MSDFRRVVGSYIKAFARLMEGMEVQLILSEASLFSEQQLLDQESSGSSRLVCGRWERKVGEPGNNGIADPCNESISLRITSAWETAVDFMWVLALIYLLIVLLSYMTILFLNGNVFFEKEASHPRFTLGRKCFLSRLELVRKAVL